MCCVRVILIVARGDAGHNHACRLIGVVTHAIAKSRLLVGGVGVTIIFLVWDLILENQIGCSAKVLKEVKLKHFFYH